MKTPTKTKVITTELLQKKLGSSFARVIPSYVYNPPPKPPSKRDLHRMSVEHKRVDIH